jgi:hypothetical protein
MWDCGVFFFFCGVFQSKKMEKKTQLFGRSMVKFACQSEAGEQVCLNDPADYTSIHNINWIIF